VLRTLSFTSRTVETGAAWWLRVLVTDDLGDPSGDMPTFTVTEPDGTEVPVTAETTTCPGVVRAIYYPAVAGRHLAAAVHIDHGSVSWVANVLDVVPNAEMPDVDGYRDYVGETSDSDDEITQALAQEQTAQFNACRVPATYPPDLAGALYRRTQRALAIRRLPLAVKESADGESQIVVPGRDPEVRRLEGPYRKVTVG
jgi:hypothetical protein